MAKKKDEFNFDEFDFLGSEFDDFGDGGFGEGNAKSGTRKAITQFTGKFFSGLKDSLFTKENQRRFLRNNLPKGYAAAFDAADFTARNVKEVYDGIRDEVETGIDGIKPSIKELNKKYGKKLGEKRQGKIDEWASDRLYRRGTPESEHQSILTEMRSTLGEIFVSGQQQQAEYSETISDAILSTGNTQTGIAIAQTKLGAQNLSFTSQIAAGIEKLGAYQDNVTTRVERKKLEISFRHYSVARQILDVNQQTLGLLKSGIESIVKNTGLPEAVKIQNLEIASDAVKRKMWGSVGLKTSQSLTNIFGEVAGKAKKNIRETLNMFFDMAAQGADGLVQGLDMALDDDFGMGQSKAQKYGKWAGKGAGMVVPWLYGKYGKGITKALQENPTLMRYGNKLQNLEASGGLLFEKFAKSNNPVAGMVSELLGLNQYVHSDNVKVRESAIQDLDKQALFDVQTQLTINEVIPGFLEKINYSLDVIRTGDSSLSPIRYSFESGRFETHRELKRKIFEKFNNEGHSRSVNETTDEIIRRYDPEGKLSPEAKKALRAYITKSAMNANGKIDEIALVSDDSPISGKVGEEIAEVLGESLGLDYIDNHDRSSVFGSLKHGWTGNDKYQTTSVAVHRLFNGLKNELPEHLQSAINMSRVGMTDLMEEDGYIKQVEDRWVLDRDAYIDRLNNPKKYIGNGMGPNAGPQLPNSHKPFIGPGGGNTTITSSSAQQAPSNNTFVTIDEAYKTELLNTIKNNNTVPLVTITNQMLELIRSQIENGIPTYTGEGTASGGESQKQSWLKKYIWEPGKWLSSKGISIGKWSASNAFKLPIKAFNWGVNKLTNTRSAMRSIFDKNVGDRIADLYAMGKERALITLKDFQENDYYDAVTGKVIKTFKDIKGAVVDKDGNFVVTEEDFKRGLYTLKEGKAVSLLGSAFSLAKDTISKVASINGNVLSNIWSMTKKAYGKAKTYLQEHVDIYIEGEKDPRLLWNLMKNGNYLNEDGTVIRKVQDIKGAVYDKMGNVVISLNELQNKLVDKNGNEVNVKSFIKDAVLKAGSLGFSILKKSIKLPFKIASSLYRKFTGNSDSFSKIFGSSKHSMDPLAAELLSTQTDVMIGIYDLLDHRMPRPTKGIFGDHDNDGIREGSRESWLKRNQNKDNAETKGGNDRPEKEKKDGILGLLMTIAGGIGGVMGSIKAVGMSIWSSMKTMIALARAKAVADTVGSIAGAAGAVGGAAGGKGKAGLFRRALGFMGRHKGKLGLLATAGGLFAMSGMSEAKAAVNEGSEAMGNFENATIKELEKAMSDDVAGAASTPGDGAAKSAEQVAKESGGSFLTGYAGELGAIAAMGGLGALYNRYRNSNNPGTGTDVKNTARLGNMGIGKQALLMGGLGAGGYMLANQLGFTSNDENNDGSTSNALGNALLWGGGILATAALPHFYNRFKEVRAEKAAQAAAGAVPAAAAAPAVKPGILSRIGSGIGRHAGPIGLGLAAYDAYKTEGGALEKTLAFGQSLGTTILASKAIGAVSGYLGKKAIGHGIRTGAMAALPYLATPMGLGALGLAAVAGGGYLIWKKWFKEDKYVLARLRFAQYGFDIEDADKVQPVAQLESMATNYVEIRDGSNEASFTKDMPVDQVLALFGVQMSDNAAVQKFANWFHYRFKPVFLMHLAVTKALTGKMSLSKTDEDVKKKADKLQYVTLVAAISPIDGISYSQVTDGPFPNIKDKLLDERKVKKAIEKATADVNKVKDDGQSATQINAVRETTKALAEKTASASGNPNAWDSKEEKAMAEYQPTVWDTIKNVGWNVLKYSPMGLLAQGTHELYKMSRRLVLNITGTLNEKYFSIRKLAVAAGEAHPDVLAAQWAIESDWGRKQSGQNNFFGIKAVGNEPGTARRTREEINGKNIWINAKFKDYPTPEDGIRDRVDFIKRNPRYSKHGYFTARTPSEAINSLVSAGYATDSNYRKALVTIITKRGIDINMSSSDITQLVERHGFKGTVTNETPSQAVSNTKNLTLAGPAASTDKNGVPFYLQQNSNQNPRQPAWQQNAQQKTFFGESFGTSMQNMGKSVTNFFGGVASAVTDTFEAISGTKDQKKMQLMVYNAFIKAGFSDAQARVLTAEVGRENAYQTRYLFGGHADPKRGHNLGMISWQGERRTRLVAFLRQQGALNPNGTIHQSQRGLDAQAAFIMQELRQAPYWNKCGKEFLGNPNIDYKRGNYLIGKFYIVWAYSEAKYASGHKNRDGFYAMLNKQLGPVKNHQNIKPPANNAPNTASNIAVMKKAQGNDKNVTVGSDAAARMGLGTGMSNKNAPPASLAAPITSAGGGNIGEWVSRDKAWFDVDAAIATMKKNSFGLGKLTGLCARYVKYGIDAGDIANRIPNGPAGHAKDYVANFKRWGWKEVPKGQPVRKGDVAVFPRTATQKGQIYGHIAMYGGDGHWYCDGTQNKVRGPYGDPTSQSRNLSYIVFRSPNCYSANPGNVANATHSSNPGDAQGTDTNGMVPDASATGETMQQAAGYAAGGFAITYRKDSFIEGHEGEDENGDSGTKNTAVNTTIGTKKPEWDGSNSSTGKVLSKTDADKVNAAVDKMGSVTVKPTDANGKTVTAASQQAIAKTVAANSAPKFNTTLSQAAGETKQANSTVAAIQQVKAEIAASAKPADDLLKVNQDQLSVQKEMLKALKEISGFINNQSNKPAPTPPKKVPNKVPVSMSKKV